MPMQEGDEVFVRPVMDTGEIEKCFPMEGEHDVFCDGLASVNRYKE